MRSYTIINLTPLLITSSLILQSLSSTDAQNQDVPFYDGDPNFLFIGNSYTGQNNLPATFKSVLLDAFPEWTDNNQIDSVNPGGRTFSAHYSGLETEADGASRRLKQHLVTDPPAYKWVTLQEQSQTGGFSQWDWEGTGYYDSLVGARGLNDLIADNTGGQTVFYMTWGRRDGDKGNDFVFPDFLTMQDRLVEGYMRYVNETSTPERPTYVAPVGLVFRTIHNDLVAQDNVPTDSGTLFHSLYKGDGSHPTASGTYVAALTIFTTMFGIDPETINWFPGSIDEETARTLQNAVGRTILENFDSGFIQFPWTQAWDTVQVGAEPTLAPTVSTSPPTVTTLQPTASAPSPIPPQPTPGAPSAIVTSAQVGTPQPTTSTPQPTTLTLSPIASTPQPTANSPAPVGIIPQPTASNSTLQPTSVGATSAPSVGNTAAPNNKPSTTKGSITIEIQYDNYPQDIAWSFLQQGKPLYFQPYGATNMPGSLQTETFSDLPLNDTYRFLIRDQRGDGLCCSHGSGYVKLTDNHNLGTRSTILYDLGETLGTYYELDINLGSLGQATVTSTSQEYVPSTWPDLEAVVWAPLTAEPEWPGTYPTHNASAVVVNVDLHDRPQDISWALYQMTTNQALLSDSDPSNYWILDTTWSGNASVAGSLNSTEVPNLQEGWYRFVVMDSAKNGLCCNPNATHNGYVTLTGPLAATSGAMGLIWGDNGEFGEQAAIRFRMDQNSYVSHVQWEANQQARSPAPSSAPAVAVSSPPTASAINQTKDAWVVTLEPQPATVPPTANVVSPTGLPGLGALTSSAPRRQWFGLVLMAVVGSCLA